MSPIQTALFMVHAWPSHCDCLALVNAVHALKDKLLVSTIYHPSYQPVPPPTRGGGVIQLVSPPWGFVVI